MVLTGLRNRRARALNHSDMHVQPDTGALSHPLARGRVPPQEEHCNRRELALLYLFDVRPLSQSPQHVLQAHGAAGWVARGGAREAWWRWARRMRRQCSASGCVRSVAVAGALTSMQKAIVPLRRWCKWSAGTASRATSRHRRGGRNSACGAWGGADCVRATLRRGRRSRLPGYLRAATRRRAVLRAAASCEHERRAGDGNFAEAVRASVEVSAGRRVVLATYYNLGMLDWAEIFWGWLVVSGYRRLLLLDLDGLTCDASRALLCGAWASALALESCVRASGGHGSGKLRDANSVQAWGTHAASTTPSFCG